MLGVGLLHLVPHAYFLLGSIDRTMGLALVGFLAMFFIERVFHFHHHGTPDESEPGEADAHDHECAHGHHDHAHPAHAHDHGHGAARKPVSWVAALLGLALHSLLDGVALAASVTAEIVEHDSARWAGLAVFLIVVLHKPFDSLTLGTLMVVAGRSSQSRLAVNLLYAMSVPLGALLFQVGLAGRGADTAWIGGVLALAAGTFLCIATSDLLPELQFHTHDRGKLSAALLLGLALSWGIVFLEESGHDHGGHSPALPGHDHSHDRGHGEPRGPTRVAPD
jgi:zinc and cadmium transporter